MAEPTTGYTSINPTAQQQSADVMRAVEKNSQSKTQKEVDQQILSATAFTSNDVGKVAQYQQSAAETKIDGYITHRGILPGNEYGNQISTDYSPTDTDEQDNKKVVGTQSIHNKYVVFKLSSVSGYTNTDGYDSLKHYDCDPRELSTIKDATISNGIPYELSHTTPAATKKFAHKDTPKPTASNIIKFANNYKNFDKPKNVMDLYITERLPYSISDFVYSKWYGKIPNTNLITLRRFAQPVTDDACNNYKQPQLPIAQALTYFGEGTGNKLSSILTFTYGLLYDKLTAEVWNVEGNETGFGNGLESVIGMSDGGKMAGLMAYARMHYGEDKESDSAKGFFNRTTALESEWSRKQWSDGAYWNQVYGPVNVINENQRRRRGMNFQNDMNLKFSYCLRSIDGINPKVAMLDLIVNFLSLTYNNARFWGGMNRYFPKTDFQVEAIGDLDQIALGNWKSTYESLSNMAKNAKENGAQILSEGLGIFALIAGCAHDIGNKDELAQWGDFKKLTEGNLTGFFSDIGESILNIFTGRKNTEQNNKDNTAVNVLRTMASANIAKNRPSKLSMHSMLSGEPVGEWHLVVGNPMNPIVVMGNMIVEKCTMNFNDTLGIDDFPTEVTFTVSLKHARPRDVADMESMFNLGCGKMSYSPLISTSSEMNTFGESWESGGGGNSMVNIDNKNNGKEDGTEKANLTFASSTTDFKNFDREYKVTHQAYDNNVKYKEGENPTIDNIRTKISNEWGNSFSNADQLHFLLQKTKIKW